MKKGTLHFCTHLIFMEYEMPLMTTGMFSWGFPIQPACHLLFRICIGGRLEEVALFKNRQTPRVRGEKGSKSWCSFGHTEPLLLSSIRMK